MSVNRCTILGRLGADPDARTLPSGQRVATLRVATNTRWTDKNGQKQESTEWHRIILFGRAADTASQFLTKGREVYVEGRIQTREWNDKDGNKRYTTEIVATDLQLIGAKPDEAAAGAGTEPEIPADVADALSES